MEGDGRRQRLRLEVVELTLQRPPQLLAAPDLETDPRLVPQGSVAAQAVDGGDDLSRPPALDELGCQARGPEGQERGGPVDRLCDSGDLRELAVPQALDEGDDGEEEALLVGEGASGVSDGADRSDGSDATGGER